MVIVSFFCCPPMSQMAWYQLSTLAKLDGYQMSTLTKLDGSSCPPVLKMARFQHSIHRWWRHYIIITSILDRRITPYLGDLCFRKYSSRRIDEFEKLPYTCIKRKGKWIIQFKMYVYVIICSQLRQKHCNRTSRKF